MARLLGQRKNAPELEALRRQVRELTTLHDIARAVISILDLQSVLNRIVEAAVYLTRGEEGFLLLVEEETGELTLRAGKGLGDRAAKVMRMKVKDTLAGQVVETGQPLRIGGAQKDKTYKVKTGYLVQSLVNVPIKTRKHKVIGVLSVDHSLESLQTFSEHDVELLSSLAEYAAIAIENAQRFEAATQRAEALAIALEEPQDRAPTSPPQTTGPDLEDGQDALEQFSQGLRAQRSEVNFAQDRAKGLAQELRAQAHVAEELSQRLGMWDEEVSTLMPALEWLVDRKRPAADETAQPDVLSPPVLELEADIDLGQQLMQALAEGILICDPKGRILAANPAATNLLGRSREGMIGLDLQELAVNDTRWERMVGSMRLALALGSSEVLPPSPAATLYFNERAVYATLVPLTMASSEHPAAIAAVLRDVSAEVEGWLAHDEAINELSESLRSPMTAIASYSDLLLGEAVGLLRDNQRRYLQRIRASNNRMAQTLADFNEAVSRHVLFQLPEDPRLNDTLQEAIDTAREELALSGVTVVTEIPEGLPSVQITGEHVLKIVSELLFIAGQRTVVGDTLEVSASLYPQNVDKRPSHVIVSVHVGSYLGANQAPLERDVKVQEIRHMAEEQGGRLWIAEEDTDAVTISFLLPIESGYAA
jgi:PAS domain S-box-containing protein